MGRTTRCSDEHLDTPFFSGCRIVSSLIRRSMRGHHMYFARNAQAFECGDRVGHCTPVGLRTHDDEVVVLLTLPNQYETPTNLIIHSQGS